MSPTDSVTDELKRANTALDTVDQATTSAGAAVTAVGTRISNLLAQIGSASDLAAAKALADRATQEAGALVQIADALTQMAVDPTNPVPVAPPVIAP